MRPKLPLAGGRLTSRPERGAGGRALGAARMCGDQRQRGRRDALDPPGLAEARGADGEELLLDLVGEARQPLIVEVGRQQRQVVAAVSGDVLGLTIKINRVFRVRLKPAHKRSRYIGKSRPNASKNREGELRLRRKLEGRAARPVAIDRKAVRLELARRRGRGVEHRPRLLS